MKELHKQARPDRKALGLHTFFEGVNRAEAEKYAAAAAAAAAQGKTFAAMNKTNLDYRKFFVYICVHCMCVSVSVYVVFIFNFGF